jgi:uncharacterized membrane protein HdeD (DUF308 family)
MTISRVLLLRGIIGIVAGVLAIMWPALTIAVLVVLFGAYALADGVANLMMGVRGEVQRRGAVILQGVIGVAVGIVAFVWPLSAAAVVLMWIAAWAIITGALQLYAAVRYRRQMHHEGLLALSGVLTILFGLALMVRPGVGAVAIAWTLGVYTFVSGIVLVVAGARAKHLLAG